MVIFSFVTNSFKNEYYHASLSMIFLVKCFAITMYLLCVISSNSVLLWYFCCTNINLSVAFLTKYLVYNIHCCISFEMSLRHNYIFHLLMLIVGYLKWLDSICFPYTKISPLFLFAMNLCFKTCLGRYFSPWKNMLVFDKPNP